MSVSAKHDGTPVTDVDLAIDDLIAVRLARVRPADGRLSEECGEQLATSSRRWIIDPLDGTSRYVDGGRDWGTLVAMEDAGRVVIAVMTRPSENLLWFASRGEGSFATVTDTTLADPERVRIRSYDPTRALRTSRGLLEPHSPVLSQLTDVEWIDDEVSAIATLLGGKSDAVIDDLGKIWDQAAPSLLVQEAGGGFWDRAGRDDPSTGWGLYASAAACDRLWPALEKHGHVGEALSAPACRKEHRCADNSH
jgi:histidinol-phosphatase